MLKEETPMQPPTDHADTALELARRAFVATVHAVKGAQRGWSSLVDQAIRAASSVPLNLSESDGRTGKDRRHLRRVAYGSAKETKVALEMLADIEAIDRRKAHEAVALMDRVCAMTWKLIGD
jgi:four helix bundle protein